MFWRIVGSIFAGIWIFNAFQMFGCPEVAFGGSPRAVVWECVVEAGDMPGVLAGFGILAIAGGVLYWLWSPLIAGNQGQGPESQPAARESQPDPVRSFQPPNSSGLGSATDPGTLREAAKHTDWGRRLQVASNQHTPTDVLDDLSTDTYKPVRLAVVENPRTPMATVKRMAENDAWDVASVQKAASDRLKEATPAPDFGVDALPRPAPSENTIEQLERLAKLYQDGLLTDDEYSAMKATLINGN